MTVAVNETARVLAEMLTENTGNHFLDSGGAYGRNWQRNQERDFDSEPASTVEFFGSGNSTEIIVTHNVYHWLLDRLEFDPTIQAQYDAFAAGPEQSEQCDYGNMQEFGDHLRDHYGAKGVYGDGDPFVVNTYNGEDCVSQVLQYLYFTLGESEYVLLQIHGGCDVRGGYTSPKAFELTEELSIMQNADASIIAVNDPEPDLPGVGAPECNYWQTDDGCHWYGDGGTGGRQLETYPATDKPELRGKDHIYIDADGVGYCPISGRRLVVATN